MAMFVEHRPMRTSMQLRWSLLMRIAGDLFYMPAAAMQSGGGPYGMYTQNHW
jgi:hypothetical protein